MPRRSFEHTAPEDNHEAYNEREGLEGIRMQEELALVVIVCFRVLGA